MSKTLTRFSVSMENDLVDQLDLMLKEKGYESRSQALSDMIRSHLVDHHGRRENCEIAGTVTLVYDHHKRNIQALLTDIQHDYGELIISTLHVHLDHHNCMEVLAVRGKSKQIRALADELISAKGVKHGRLTVTTTGEGKSAHKHAHD